MSLSSEDKFRVAFESANVGKSITLPTGELDVNQAFCDMLGYTREELSNKKWQDITPADEIDAIQKLLDSLLQGKKNSVRFNKRYIHKSGKDVWADVSVIIHRDVHHNPLFFITTVIDITERKHMESQMEAAFEALRKSERQYRFLMDNIKDVLWVMDAQTMHFLYVSPSMARLRGYTPEEIIAAPVTSALTAEHREYVINITRSRVEDLLSGKEPPDKFYTDEVEQPCKDGSTVWTEVITNYYINPENGRVELRGVARDITDRKRAEVALRENENKFRETIKYLDEGYYSVTMDGVLLDHNQAYSRILGLDINSDLKGQMTPDFWQNPDDRKQYLDLLSAQGFVRNFPVNVKKISGEKIFVLLNAHLVKDEKDNLLRIEGTIVDITDRKHVEQALMDRDALFARITSQVPGMLYQFERKPDGAYSVPYSNDGVMEIFGCSPEDVRHTFDPIFMAIFPDDRDRIKQTIEASAKNMSPWMCEYRVQLPGKPVKWILGNSIPEKMPDGAIVWSGYNTDITGRKRTEARLKESEVQYRNLADTGLALIWTSGTDKLCNYFNEPWLKFTGRALAEEIGNGWTQGVHPDDLDRCVQIYVTAFDKREAFDMEYRLHHAGGEYRWIRDLGTPNYDVSGEFIGYIGHCFDITGQKQAEEEILKLNENLEQRINERTDELKKTIAELEEVNRTFVGRELRMIELKKQIAELEEKT